MAPTQAFYDWDGKGRPYKVCTPIVGLTGLARRHGYPILGTIGNEEHLRSPRPQDHTPYSVTPWPLPLPGYVVTACDIEYGPYVDQLIADAKSGRAPWIKYINARGYQWNVRNNWVPVPNSDQHCHVSARTDQLTWWDPTWDPFNPNASGNEEDMTPDENRRLFNVDEGYFASTIDMQPEAKIVPWGNTPADPKKTVPNKLVRTLAEIRDDVKALGDTNVTVDGAAVAEALMAHPEFMTRLAGELAANLAERLKD